MARHRRSTAPKSRVWFEYEDSRWAYELLNEDGIVVESFTGDSWNEVYSVAQARADGYRRYSWAMNLYRGAMEKLVAVQRMLTDTRMAMA